jgi:RNA polymerase sigma-70 factor (ECF subfamily)
VNGQPGVMFLDPDGALLNVVSLDIVDDQIQTLRAVSNPDKLRHLGKVSDGRFFRSQSDLPDSVVVPEA